MLSSTPPMLEGPARKPVLIVLHQEHSMPGRDRFLDLWLAQDARTGDMMLNAAQ